MDLKLYVNLVKNLKKKYGADASQGPSFVNAYNAATMLFSVVSDGSRSRASIRDALVRLHVGGIGVKDLSFTNSGQLSGVKFIIKTIVDNKFEEIK